MGEASLGMCGGPDGGPTISRPIAISFGAGGLFPSTNGLDDVGLGGRGLKS
jgi:hypothetical protein